MIRVCQDICLDDERINTGQTCVHLYSCTYCTTVASGTCVSLSYHGPVFLACRTASMPPLTVDGPLTSQLRLKVIRHVSLAGRSLGRDGSCIAPKRVR